MFYRPAFPHLTNLINSRYTKCCTWEPVSYSLLAVMKTQLLLEYYRNH